LITDVPYNVDPARITLAPHAGAALRLLRRQGYALLVVSNQAGVAKGLFPESALQDVEHRLAVLLAKEEVQLDGFYYCPHHPDGVVSHYAIRCACRKPMPGMIRQAALEHDIELAGSWMIGDILDDVECGLLAGCETVLINNGNETEWVTSTLRTPRLITPDLLTAARTIPMVDKVLFSLDRAYLGALHP
jgi:D-glycero-D-manno-heptose 1,7-bisphosphate phosphatase